MGEGQLHELTLSPVTHVFPRVDCGTFSTINEDTAMTLVTQLLERNSEEIRNDNGALRGYLSYSWETEEIADLLDAFSLSGHNPDNSVNPMTDYYRKPSTAQPVAVGLAVKDDPYQVAAYLRWWARKHPESAPLFNVGVAVGEVSGDCAPFPMALLNRQISEEDRVLGGWTGRSAGWRGDAYFDNPPVQLRSTIGQRRSKGAAGLLLLYVIHKNARGRTLRGKQRTHHTPALGIAIPGGGPVFRRVTVGA
jgi:hypothetical protein